MFSVTGFRHGRRKEFFQGVSTGDFSQIFLGGTKSGGSCFFPARNKENNLLLLKLLKSKEAKAPFPPSDAHVFRFYTFNKINYLRTVYFPVFTCRLCFDLFILVLLRFIHFSVVWDSNENFQSSQAFKTLLSLKKTVWTFAGRQKISETVVCGYLLTAMHVQSLASCVWKWRRYTIQCFCK